MNILDSVISVINPQAGLRRIQARNALEVARSYDAASNSSRNSGWFRPNTSAAQEVSKAAEKLANTGQELCRNNPLARRVKRTWANSAVGGGIVLNVHGVSDTKNKKFNDDFDDWAESTDCDFEGHHTLYGLEWLWVSTIVESGAVFIRQHINAKKQILQLQTFEQSQLDRSKTGMTDKGSIIDGIQFSGEGQIEGYWFMVDPTNTKLGRVAKSKFHSVDMIIHIYDKERAGQHLGVSWLHAVANTLKNYNTSVDAKLMQQQIAACFALIIEDAQTPSGLGLGEGTATMPDEIQPSMIEHVQQGTKIHTVTPPKADNSSSFDMGIKRDIAMGTGLSYEQFSGDYSQVNFASGRMGKMDFFAELDHMQKHILLPALNKIFKWFDTLYQVKKGKGRYKADWTFPPRAAVNPKEEFDVLMSKVRHGMKSPSKAAKELGEKLPLIIAQWNKDKELFGDLPFDIDPSVFAATGNQLDDNDAASQNKPD